MEGVMQARVAFPNSVCTRGTGSVGLSPQNERVGPGENITGLNIMVQK